MEQNFKKYKSISLEGKCCLITGGSTGIGLETAILFAKLGAKLFLSGRSKENLQEASKQIKSKVKNAQLELIECDISIEKEVKILFQTIFKKFNSTIDILVANAGILESSLIGMVTNDHINKIFTTNTFGYIYCCQYASRLMMRNKLGGSIIGISSIMGLNGYAGYSVYSSSKASIIGMTKSLAKELAPSKIRVNCLAPGFIDTNMTSKLPKSTKDEVLKSIRMGRSGKAIEVANAALFLASDMSEYITGQVISIDGGMIT